MPGESTLGRHAINALARHRNCLHAGDPNNPAQFIKVPVESIDEVIRLARLGLEAERRTIDLTGEAMRDCIEYLHKNDGFRSLRVRVFDGEIKLEILTAAKGLEPIAEARSSLFHDAVAALKDDW